MAYLYRKRGHWYVAYRTPEGWKRKSLKTKKKAEAEQALPRFRRREAVEDAPPDSRTSLSDFCSYYCEHRRQHRVSPATIKSDLFLIKHMFRTAGQWGFLPENPGGGIRPPKVADTRKSRALTEDEVEALRVAAEGSPIRPLIVLADQAPG